LSAARVPERNYPLNGRECFSSNRSIGCADEPARRAAPRQRAAN